MLLLVVLSIAEGVAALRWRQGRAVRLWVVLTLHSGRTRQSQARALVALVSYTASSDIWIKIEARPAWCGEPQSSQAATFRD